MLVVKTEIYSLEEFTPWSGAVQTWEFITGERLGEEFIASMEGIYPGGITQTELNDLLWHESDWCLELVGLVWED